MNAPAFDYTKPADCGHMIAAPGPGASGGTGYGRDPVTGKSSCYACCAEIERNAMVHSANGRTSLYYSHSTHEVTDWAGKLRFSAYDIRVGRGGGFGREYDIATGHFRGPDGFVWSFRNQGGNDIARCRRTKQTCAPNGLCVKP